MRRLHLIEIEDQSWCPGVLRDAATDYLRFALLLTNPYRAIVSHLRRALERTGQSTLIDLGAGGSGPWTRLLPQLADGGPHLKIYLTDKFPNLAAFERARHQFPRHLDYARESVDAAHVPPSLRGFRTMFSAFHHFPPEQAQAILADAVRQGQGIGIFEATRRDSQNIFGMLLTPLLVWLTTPAMRPFRWSRLLLTYALPLVPVLVPFDGIVSCLRTYTPIELWQLVSRVEGAETYEWEIGEERIDHRLPPVTYLIGYPARPEAALSEP